MTSYASNAVLAKARAMYGKRLTPKDYSNLLSCKSLPEVIAYLKAHTKYSSLLNNMNDREVHRGQLEAILRQQIFFDFESLCRYEISVGEHFSEYIIKSTEIQQIMHFLMLLTSGHPEEYLYVLPLYFTKVSRINLKGFASAKSYDDFLASLEGTPYYKLLLSYKPQSGESLNLTGIENTLYTYLYKLIYKLIDKHHKGREKAELEKYFDKCCDLNNFVRIVRLSKYYNMRGESIKRQLLPFGTLKEDAINAMCSADSSKDIFAVMQSTMAGKCISKMEYSTVSDIVSRGQYSMSRHNIRFSTNAAIVMLAYMTLEQTELTNIINIIEGIRYSVDPDRIRDILIYY